MQTKENSPSRIKSILKWAIILLLFLGLYYLTIEPLYTPTAISTPNEKFLLPKFIAHKAIISGTLPGNSKAALQEALNSAVEGIELDIRLSKDKVPFIFHAETLESIGLGNGRPEEKNWSELSPFVLSLEEVLKQVGKEKYLFLDIKEFGIFDNDFAQKIAELIERYDMKDTVIVESLNPIFLTYIRLQARDIKIMYDFVTNTMAFGEETQSQFDAIPWLLKQPFFQMQIRRILRPDILGPRWNVSGRIIKELINNGYPIIAWTVDDASAAEKLFNLGVTGVETNTALQLMQALNYEMPQKVEDVGGSIGYVENIIYVTRVQEVLDALQKAREQNLKISIAGRKHSMGGQSFLSGSLHLDMQGFNKIYYDPETKRVTAEAGATWNKIQKLLNQYDRSVIIMQSDTIFTVGGSTSVNVHGWQSGMPPLGSSIHSLKVATADGQVKTISAEVEPELFSSVIGGYGQFAVILEIEFNTTANSEVIFHTTTFPANQFASKFSEIVENNPRVELAYGRLSVDESNLLTEASLNWYEKTGEAKNKIIDKERFIALKRTVFRFSEYTDLGKKLRWNAEKTFNQNADNAITTRNTAMSPDIHVLWPVRVGYRDILQEYFVPKAKLNLFIEALRKRVKENPINLLNVTIRELRKDTISALPYAKEDVFCLVLLFSQADDAEGEITMKKFTADIIDDVLALNGSFYLPYRLHYSMAQLDKGYPMLQTWFETKKRWDPNNIFSSDFFNNITSYREMSKK